MQLMADAVAVLGSRHGVVIDPAHAQCRIIRFDPFDKAPRFKLAAGAIINGKRYVLPLGGQGERFDFYDQRISPCTISMMAVHATSNVKVKLTIAAPFRPRDTEFSTTPVLDVRLTAEALPGHYRWTKKTVEADQVELFLAWEGETLDCVPAGDRDVDMRFESTRRAAAPRNASSSSEVKMEPLAQHDRLVLLSGRRDGCEFRQVSSAAAPAELHVAWCTWSEPVLEVQQQRVPFRYARKFTGLNVVCDWARANPDAIAANAETVDRIVGDNDCSLSVNNLLAQTLHSWLINTWWATAGQREWFSVCEGNCYFHSTVDVEYTQAPFYLSVWPELLGIELDWWPEFSKDGAAAIGERGAGTKYLSHDMGQFATANGQVYPHDMEVEEVSNYIILSYAYWRRMGDDGYVRKHIDTIRAYMDFIRACDTTGNGVPDIGMANTIDDASPAIQFGKEQIYLAVKAMAAFVVGAAMLKHADPGEGTTAYEAQADAIRSVISQKGWLGDHFATLLTRSGYIVNPWSGVGSDCAEIPGWDAAHIYTVNGMAVLDMVGLDLGINRQWITKDLQVATQRCLSRYGCTHSDYVPEEVTAIEQPTGGLAGMAASPGWVSMNMLRDIAAFYRGVDLRYLSDRYWEWQTTTNSQDPAMFFETFKGSFLSWYPRGVAIWGYFDALAGRVIDKVAGIDETRGGIPQVRAPRLIDAEWAKPAIARS